MMMEEKEIFIEGAINSNDLLYELKQLDDEIARNLLITLTINIIELFRTLADGGNELNNKYLDLIKTASTQHEKLQAAFVRGRYIESLVISHALKGLFLCLKGKIKDDTLKGLFDITDAVGKYLKNIQNKI